MKLINYLIIFLVVIVVYGSPNFYIFIRGWQALPKILSFRIIYLIIFLLLSTSFFTGRIVENLKVYAASEILIWLGSVWLGFFLYLFLGVLLIDILRLLNYFFSIFPSAIRVNPEKIKLIAASAIITISLITVIIGYISAKIPAIKKIELTISKKTQNMEVLHIAAASDIHLGSIISNSRIEKLVDRINELQPDIVLFPGDIVDEDISSIIKKNPGEIFKGIKSKYGVFAVTGNHEIYAVLDKSVKFMEDHNITVLRDTAVKIDNNFYLVGRDDRSLKNRKSLKEIIKNIDCSMPVIMMDHQPFSLHSVAETYILICSYPAILITPSYGL